MTSRPSGVYLQRSVTLSDDVWCKCASRRWVVEGLDDILKQLLDQVDVRHDHAAAAIALAAELVHGITVGRCQSSHRDCIEKTSASLTHQERCRRSARGSAPRGRPSPASQSAICWSGSSLRDGLANLATGEAPDGNNHLNGS